ncbi:WSSV061 [White spot syndrome virus]|uniref:WSSV061 n=1 Tax=White spot syndrome virus TaxID=342409 RepID=A0A2I6SBJ2_9VIRU|nr:WSSV061 [White spot syndrome virus]
MEQYNAQMAANTIPQLVNRLTIPGSITADTAINVVKAFTENGEFSNAETHLGLWVTRLMKCNLFSRTDSTLRTSV